MAEPLKNYFNESFIDRIAQMFLQVAPELDWKLFKKQAQIGFETLELLDRARHIANCLARALPADFPQAAQIVIDSLGPAHEVEQHSGMEAFIYLPHCMFVAHHGLNHFDAAMRANYELTKRFTAEFSVRPFIEQYPKESLALFEAWVLDPNVHVRRLVSEGTRPRLPWWGALKVFANSPESMIALLLHLRDDPHEYVRRSVANHLNDIGKEHPQLLVRTCAKWMKGASLNRQRLIKHALRSLVKQGHAEALQVLGFREAEGLTVRGGKVTPRQPSIGSAARVDFAVENCSGETQAVLVDLKVHYVKANGSLAPKVFKLTQFVLAAGESKALSHKLSFKQMTTRTHYPGKHLLEVLINGRTVDLAEFTLRV